MPKVAPPHGITSALIVLIILTPWPLGSRLPWAAMTSVIVALLVALAWLFHASRASVPMRPHLLYLPMAGFLIWTGGLWALGATAYGHAAATGWCLLLGYAAAMFLASQLGEHPTTSKRLQAAIVYTGIAVALFGILQFLTWNGYLYWFYDPPYEGTRFGPFNNRNYFAGYMIVALGPALGIVFSEGRRRPILVYLTWLAVLATLMSLSRGGAFGLALSLLVAFWLGRKPRPLKRWEKWALPVVAVLALLVGLGLLNQTDRVLTRLETMFAFQQETSFTGRVEIWQAALAMFQERPITGWGLDSFGWVMAKYRPNVTSSIAMHAHNEYLEVLAETGIVGALICVAFVILLFREGLRRLRRSRSSWERGLRAGALAAWAGTLVYAITDFPTIIPAISYVLAILAGLTVAPHAESAAASGDQNRAT